MKANNTFSLFAILLGILFGSLLVGRATATSGFSQSCDEIVIAYDGSSVEAKCQVHTPMGPPWICSKLDLNLCLGNQGGRLIAQDHGHFTGLCKDCGESESLVIGCQCWTGGYYPGGSLIYHYTEYSLDDVVGNYQGFLRCFDNLAPKSSGCT